MPNTSEHITIRVPSDLAQRIRARAEDEGRSLSGMVVRLVQYAMTGTAPNDRPAKLPTGLMEDVRNHIATSSGPVPLPAPKHAPTCKCLMCKPPKSGESR